MKNGLKRPKIRFVEDCGGPVRFDFSNPRITDPTHVSTANSTQYTRRLERNFQWWCHVSSGEPLPRDLHHPITVTLYLLLYLLNHQISLYQIKFILSSILIVLFCWFFHFNHLSSPLVKNFVFYFLLLMNSLLSHIDLFISISFVIDLFCIHLL
jgi:hypothetical protein